MSSSLVNLNVESSNDGPNRAYASQVSEATNSIVETQQKRANNFMFVAGGALIISFALLQAFSLTTRTCGSNSPLVSDVTFDVTHETFNNEGVLYIADLGSFRIIQLIAFTPLVTGLLYIIPYFMWFRPDTMELSQSWWRIYQSPLLASAFTVTSPLLEISLLAMFGIRNAIFLFVFGLMSSFAYIICYISETQRFDHSVEDQPLVRSGKGQVTHTASNGGVIASFAGKATVWIAILWAAIFQGLYNTNQALWWALVVICLSSLVTSITSLTFCFPCDCFFTPNSSETRYYYKQMTDVTFAFIAQAIAPWLFWSALQHC